MKPPVLIISACWCCVLQFAGSAWAVPEAPATAEVAPVATAPATPPTTDEKPEKKDKYPEFSTSARLMTGFEHNRVRPDASQGVTDFEETGFFVQQARVKLKGKLNKLASFNFSADLSDGINPAISAVDLKQPEYMRNAFINLRFRRALQLRLGHFKRPYSRLELRGAGDLQVRGRGLINDLAVEDSRWGGRALGMMLHGKFKHPRLSWYLGVSNPTWEADLTRKGIDVLGRVTYNPLRWLSLGVGGGHKSVELANQQVQTNAGTFDVEIKHSGFYFMTEAQLAQLAFELDTPTGFGFVALTSYDIKLTKNYTLQPALFGEYADAHSEFTETEAIRTVAGINSVLFEQLRIMPQVELIRPLGDVSALNPWLNTTAFYLLVSLEV